MESKTLKISFYQKISVSATKNQININFKARRNYAMKKMKPGGKQNSEENEDEMDMGKLKYTDPGLELRLNFNK